MKTLKKMSVLLGIMLMLVGVAACSNKEEAARVAEKIEQGKTLEQGDYTTMISYLGHFAEKAQPLQNRINDMSSDNPQAGRLAESIDSLKKANPYLELFAGRLDAATESEVGADNVKLVNKYAGYEWFNAPAWATVTEDPGVAGMVVETPPAGQDTGVVAGAVDEEKVREL